MAADGSVFERYEKKYLVNRELCDTFLKEIEPYMQQDKYGLHTICNIYYDTRNYELIRTSIDKPEYKEKLRLRSYGIPNHDSKVFLEIKKKYAGVVYKRRIELNYDEADRFLKEGKKPEGKYSEQIYNEIKYFISYYKPEPALYLAYDRMAFFGKENPDVRITIDKNIRSRQKDMELAYGDEGEKLFDEDLKLIEIKIPGAFPMWLSNILDKLNIYPVSFSKYGSIYKKKFVNGEIRLTDMLEMQPVNVSRGLTSEPIPAVV